MGEQLPDFLKRKRVVAQLTPEAQVRVEHVAKELGLTKARAIDAIIRALDPDWARWRIRTVLDDDASAILAWKRGGST